MNYRLSFEESNQQKIHIVFTFHAINGDKIILPLWRPGRYEIQHFDRYISGLRLSETAESKCSLVQYGSHEWRVFGSLDKEISIEYDFYCNQLDAGGSYVDDSLIYLNPINFSLYVERLLSEPVHVSIEWPEVVKIGGNLHSEPDGKIFDDFHHWVDSPILADQKLIQFNYELNGITFYFWISGNALFDLTQLASDCKTFTHAQLKLFQDFPVNEYHFLLICPDYKLRHGVEHLDSTVIIMGPAFKAKNPQFYKSLLEICSHELFHVWNVKSFRPKELNPYSYHKKVYSSLHYITEGITTCYGDLLLFKAGLWSFSTWINNVNEELRMHYRSGADKHISLSASSFNSWVNGYHRKGFPNRRISFYTKGHIVSLLLDLMLRKNSDNQYSVDQLIRECYKQFSNRGYDAKSFWKLVSQNCPSEEVDVFCEKYIDGTDSLLPALELFADYYGLELKEVSPANPFEAILGIKVSKTDKGFINIDQVFEGSPSEAAGIIRDDEIIAINQKRIDLDASELLIHELNAGEPLIITIFRKNKLINKQVYISHKKEELSIPQLFLLLDPSREQLANRQALKTIGI